MAFEGQAQLPQGIGSTPGYLQTITYGSSFMRQGFITDEIHALAEKIKRSGYSFGEDGRDTLAIVRLLDDQIPEATRDDEKLRSGYLVACLRILDDAYDWKRPRETPQQHANDDAMLVALVSLYVDPSNAAALVAAQYAQGRA